MPRNETIDRVIEGVTDNGNVWADLLRSGNAQLYRFNRLVIDELERTQEERAKLFQQWATSPTDITGFANSLFLTWTRRSRRRMELTRTAFDDLRDMGAGTRSLWERTTDANRRTARATLREGRETIGRVAQAASNVAEDLGDDADKVARDLKRGSRRADPRLN
jgi:cell division septum initiation protein DivIVA